ncbi:hypothetical protein ACI3LY_004357 [Candidozyma auris]|uniref:Sulfhydryl oxidase n=2 Tax=Candidozyma auris TaxID=498019 RepID=A0A2H0ZCP2_CANAR|nr:flavin-linked sulfhydryl oxidase [[Candida] auris]KNE01914.2 hypothetical protein QG37_01262 [[Candida] auris]PIS48401.1 hypothetical protein B9J08_005093 [[Candida] auris]PIS49015.1 hypothetical protein CJI97_005178 [[Candida] auris]QEO22995.1 hypothetical_protein [[Candida] auris]QRG39458.1 hypothetical protein FDK38_003902 [[Candida] auris]
MFHPKRPFFAVCLLLLVSCAIYFVASGDSTSLGSSGPVTVRTPVVEKQTDIKLSEKESKKIEDEAADVTNSKAQSVGEFTEQPFMPKMANETLKAQLGNSAWHLLHTVLARYPEKPNEQQKATLKQYIHLFAQVYPCGDCARHFQGLLSKYPPQVSSRKNAALWGCDIHNKVNERLKKPIYDCSNILEDYDCGCGSDEKEADATLGGESVDHLRQIKVDEKENKAIGG